MSKCVIPGTFDPIHEGHINIISRSSKIFDIVVVAVAKSSEKSPKHSLDDRIKFAKEKCEAFSNVEIKSFDCLLVDFVKKEKANCVVRGLRNSDDFEYESSMLATNKMLSDDFETLFLLSDPQLKGISSTLIRELESLGVNVSDLTKDISACQHPNDNKKTSIE